MKSGSFGIKITAIIIALFLCFPLLSVSANTKSAIELSLDYSGSPIKGGEIIIKIKASKPAAALEAIEFTLTYESDYVTPVITENDETNLQMNAFIKSLPNGWEQMCNHSAEKEMYNLRFVLNEGEDYLDNNGELLLEIPFKIKAAGSFDFVIDGNDIIAVENDDGLSIHTGLGDTLSVAAASSDDKLGIKLRGYENAIPNTTYYLDIDAVNLGDAAGLVAFEFRLKYDKNVFSPIITENTEDNPQMDDFIVSSPKNAWEQICYLDQTNGYYILRFAAKHCESKTQSEILDIGKALSISIPFKVVGTIGRSGSFSVDKATVVGIDNDSTAVWGVGDSTTVLVINGDKITVPSDKYTVFDNVICGIREKTPISEFLVDFENAYITDSKGNLVTNGYVATDYILTNGAERYKLVVTGDVTCDGVVDVKDYSTLKRICMSTYYPTNGQIKAACIVNENEPDSKDYTALKRYCFGTYDIYS